MSAGYLDYQTFPTRRAARAYLATMRGWDARVVRIDAGDRLVWAIQCDRHGYLYLRDNGYVR